MEKILFGDETRIELRKHDGRSRAYRRSEKRFAFYGVLGVVPCGHKNNHGTRTPRSIY